MDQMFESKSVKEVLGSDERTKLLEQFQNQEILKLLYQRGLIQFLKNVSFEELQDAIKEKQVQAQKRANQNKKSFQINVLDLSMKELYQHCVNKGLCSFIYNQDVYQRMLRSFNRKAYCQMLVFNFPDEFRIGQSHHANRSDQINQEFGFTKQNNFEENQQSPQEEQNGSQQQDSFVVPSDKSESESYYSDEEQRFKKSKSKNIEKRKKKNKRKLKKLIIDDVQQVVENVKKEDYIFIEQNNERQQNDRSQIKKNTIDSDND